MKRTFQASKDVSWDVLYSTRKDAPKAGGRLARPRKQDIAAPTAAEQRIYATD